MRGNIPIPEIPHAEDLWLMVVITSVREKRTQQGKRFADEFKLGDVPAARQAWLATRVRWPGCKPVRRSHPARRIRIGRA